MLQEKSLEGIICSLRQAGIPPRLEPNESRLLMQVLRLVADGRPASLRVIDEIASNLEMGQDAARSFINRISERDIEGNVVGILGLSQNRHPHQFEVNGGKLSTWCAWDSLFLPPLLKKPASVHSFCPVTKTEIRLTVTPERVARYDPPSAVVSIITPKTTTKTGSESAEEIWPVFCHYVHFFSTSEAASEWFSTRNMKAAILSIEEGYLVGRRAFRDLLEYA
ncbi:MAG: organomercurial lyase [Candidatus Bathyarchaeia archaeon]